MQLNVKVVDGKPHVTDGDGKPLDWVDSVRILPADDGSLMLCLCCFHFDFTATLGAAAGDNPAPAPAPAPAVG